MLKLTTDKHEASRGRSATAELLVCSDCKTFQDFQLKWMYYSRNVMSLSAMHSLLNGGVVILCTAYAYHQPCTGRPVLESLVD